jgi:hypothetical protein
MLLTDEELAALKTSNVKAHDAYVAQRDEAAKLKAAAPKPKPKEEEDDEEDDSEADLQTKAKLEREEKEKGSAREKKLESAIRFTMGSTEFLKQNEALLPKDASDIFRLADKENYADAIEKDQAIKSGLIQSFFQVQHNVDLLTPGQKSILDDYLRLTKTGKQEKAQYVYDMIFEPAFDTLKRQKKAEVLGRGHADTSDVQKGYKDRLMAGSKKHYLGEKNA